MKDIEDQIALLRLNYASAVATRNVTALMQLYDAKARIFDAWGVWEYDRPESWKIAIEGWFSSSPDEKLRVEFNDVLVIGNAGLATMTAIVGYAAVSPSGVESHSLQNRITWVVKTTGHSLRIIHEHTSAPIGFEDMKAILKKSA